MRAPDSELQDACAGLGTPVNTDRYSEPFAALFRRAVQATTTLHGSLRPLLSAEWADRPLHLVFTDAEHFEAKAVLRSHADYIVVSVGTIQSVLACMYGLMSMPGFLPEVGNAANERALPQLPNGFPPMPIPLREDADKPVRLLCYPLDPLRRDFASSLAESAIHFVLLHELGHILAGHRWQTPRESSGPECGKTKGLQTPRLPPLRVLECDADAFATFHTAFVELHPTLHSLWSRVFGRKLPARHAAFVTLGLSVGGLFRIIDEETSHPPAASSPSDYPHPFVRSNLVLSKSFTLGMDAGQFVEDDWPFFVSRSLLAIENTWHQLDLPGRRLGEPREWGEKVTRLSAEAEKDYIAHKPALVAMSRLPPRWHHLSWKGCI